MRVLFTNESPLIKYGLRPVSDKLDVRLGLSWVKKNASGRSFAGRTAAPVIVGYP